MNIKPQVLERILTLKDESPKMKRTDIQKIRIVVLGSKNSGKDEFFNYILQYYNFSTEKSKQNYCIVEIPGYYLEVIVLEERFMSHFKELHPAGVIMMYRQSDMTSLEYVNGNIHVVKKQLCTQLEKLNQFQGDVITGQDLCEYVQTKEAEPLILVLGIKDAENKMVQQLKEHIFQEGQRIQELNELNETCVSVLTVLSEALAAEYSPKYFKQLEKLQAEDAKCIGM